MDRRGASFTRVTNAVGSVMRSHIDWLTFTMTPRYDHQRQGEMSVIEAYGDALNMAFVATFGVDLAEMVFGGTWEKNERSRAPYKDAWKLGESGITLFAAPELMHCCVEVSGNGCERLISQGTMQSVLNATAQKVTRIDIACDILTETTPTQFVGKKTHKRMTASGYQKSAQGETCYVGSQKSDRYARVYRYNPPHPRSDLLRVEHVFRRDYAKVVAGNIVVSGVEAVAASAAKAFGWAHPDWEPGIHEDRDLRIVKGDRAAGKTVYWLVHSAAPAFQKLVKSGVITDAEQFLARYFAVE